MNKIAEWFVHNPIAANLLMILIIGGGLLSISGIDKRFFPESSTNKITVTTAYPGAGPAEVEQQLCMRIEEAVDDLTGIEEMVSTAREGSCTVTLDVELDYDSQRLLNDVKSRVDGINTFPAGAERPLVSEVLFKSRDISMVLAGDIGEANLKELGEQIRDEVSALPNVQIVDLMEPRLYEVAIEVSEQDLRRYGLRFDDVVNAVKKSSLNLPAGKIRSKDGDIQLQTRAQGYVAADFERIVLVRKTDGTQVLLGDVASINDGFAEKDIFARFNNMPTLSLNIYNTSSPNILATSEEVNRYIEEKQAELPPGVTLIPWRDMSNAFKDRLGTLASNGLGGLVLVFILLMLFLRPRLAFWVCAGIAVAFLGTLMMMPVVNASFNMLTMFSFILILGIVVDDAIIVGEAVHSSQQAGTPAEKGAIQGTQLVLKPVFFAVFSTMVFFATFFFLPGDWAGPSQIAKIVVLALTFSLIESMFILPAHLAHMKPEVKNPSNIVLRKFEQVRASCAQGMVDFANNIYRPFLELCMEWKGLTIVSFIMALFMVVTLMAGGWIQSTFWPRVPVDSMRVNINLPEGGPFAEVVNTMDRVEQAGMRLREEINSESEMPFIGNLESVSNTNGLMVTMELLNVNDRDFTNEELKEKWQEYIGEIPSAETYNFNYTMLPISKPIELQLCGPDAQTLIAATTELKAELARYPGVHNIRDTLDNPRSEIQLKLKPQAETLNITLADLANQVRRGFYGEEVQRIPRMREDVRVMVRYPKNERNSETFLREMRIRTPDGSEVPFETVADIEYVPSYQVINRTDRKRTAKVTADLYPGNASKEEITFGVMDKKRDELEQKYRGLEILVKGEQSDSAEFLETFQRLIFLATLIIYGLMAVAFKSYLQPLLVVIAVPFGLMGALIGHLLLGLPLSMLSFLGIIACAGVVVNDNLVLIDRVNRLRDSGLSLKPALMQAAQNRFRPIILTSLTTFIGLVPIMMETSTQAQFLIPMVVSLAFGVLMATLVTLIFVPVLYLKADKVKRGISYRLSRLLGSISKSLEA